MAIARFYPSLFSDFAKEKSIKVPEDPDKDFAEEEYPHFVVYLNLHLGRPYDDYSLERNAELIAKISDEEVKDITAEQLEALGIDIHGSSILD
jgi:hypothetical protein